MAELDEMEAPKAKGRGGRVNARVRSLDPCERLDRSPAIGGSRPLSAAGRGIEWASSDRRLTLPHVD